MSTPTDHLQTNTHSKLTKRRAAAERVSLSAGFPGQKAACRLGKQQSKLLCSALSWAHQRPQDRSKAACTSPLPHSQQRCIFHTRGPAFQGTPSATKLKGTSQRVSRAPARNFVPLRARSSERRRLKGRVLGGPARQACPLFAWRGKLTVVVRKGLTDTKSTHRAHGSIFWRPRRAHN